MKKYIFTLLFGIFLMSMQTASAATLTLTNFLEGTVNIGSGLLVNGTATGNQDNASTQHSYSEWDFTLSDAANVTIWLSNFALPTPAFVSSVIDSALTFNDPHVLDMYGAGPVTQFLAAGNYTIGIIAIGGTGIPYDLNISTPAPVPVPAALWLFGSGLMGLLGSRRKSRKA